MDSGKGATVKVFCVLFCRSSEVNGKGAQDSVYRLYSSLRVFKVRKFHLLSPIVSNLSATRRHGLLPPVACILIVSSPLHEGMREKRH